MLYYKSYNKPLSHSDKTLLQAIRYHNPDIIIKHLEETMSAERGDTVLLIGCGLLRPTPGVKYLNPPHKILQMVDKVKFFEAAPPGLVLTATKSRAQALMWANLGCKVVCHTDTAGARGEGNCIVDPGYDIPDAKLYTKFQPSVAEYRVICVGGVAVYKSPRHHTRFERTMPLLPDDKVTKTCELVASTMGFDYVGFDVLELADGSGMVVEANSAPLVTYAVASAVAPALGQLIGHIDRHD